MFSSGYPNACLSVARTFEALQQEVFFVHKNDGLDWWDDVKELAASAPKRIHLDEILKEKKPLDLLIEASWFVSPLQRPDVATRCVWYCRKPAMFTDLESSTYISKPEGRNLEGISAIWLADQFTTPDDISYIQTLYPKIPLEVLPWTWTPDIVEAHRKQLGSPVWFQVYGMVPKEHEWTIHITESNQSNTSSCTLPLTIVRQAQLTKKMPVSRVMIHNSEMLAQSQFFKENVLRHTEVADLSFNLLGRQRIIDWVHEAHSLLLTHSRFLNLKMGNLEAAWVGMPVVHNSSVLRDLGQGLEKLYYESNKITDAASRLQSIFENPSAIPYLTDAAALGELRKKILFQWFPAVKAEPWAHAFNRVMTLSTLPLKVVEIKPQAPVSAPSPVAQSAPSITPPLQNPTFRILFTDMWDDFNPKHNMFVLAVEEALKKKKVVVSGFSKEDIGSGDVPDLTIFGPFGETWKTLPPTWPKVHFTGENTKPIQGVDSVKLSIGFKLPEISDDTYLRMPLWMFEIDWFGADLNAIQNPVPLPIDACTKATPETYETRKKFCAFVVTNPRNEVRNQAFWTLNSYKPVDSAGRLFNNVGDVIFAGLGGGGGERKKHEFLKQYRFCLAYENQADPGYTTEKLLHAKAAGCVPIYWGDPKVGRDFNEKGFLNANGCRDPTDLIRLVDEVESNPQRWKELASVPALSTYNRDLVRRTFAEMVKRFIGISGRKDLASELPMFIGAKTSAEADELRKGRGFVPTATTSAPEAAAVTQVQQAPAQPSGPLSTPLVVTCASRRFWPSLLMWLNTYKTHAVSLPDLKARVYVMADVADGSLEMTAEKYKDFAEFIRLPTETPKGFDDFWEPQHYAWKLWIYKALAHEEALKDRLILYTDAGSVTLRWPTEWLAKAKAEGVCLLEDPRQTNEQWCHETLCKRMSVTEEEKKGQQVVGGLMAFVAGSEAACRLFGPAHFWACDRDVIVGEKWSGLGPDGKPRGHRHDQSILSVLSQHQGLARYPLDRVYGDTSARATFQNGQAIYVHRGNYQAHQQILPGIDDAYVINLDRREDRKKAFLEHHPDFKGKIRRLPAYDGRKLTLTPYLARLFKTNDFFWKKAVMGCALSHLKIWTLLTNEPAEIENFLIMEDDARLAPGWKEAWTKAYPSLPEDWDCVYLGGILPPNRAGFATTLERIAPGLARVAPNKFFGQREPTRYFHFCAYAYVLSRRGALKILESILDRDGYWTSADHMICNRVDAMNLYVLDPLVAGASQDNDPMYQKAEFNNFSRVDSFDSDLWNNDERFSPEEIATQLGKGTPLHISEAFTELDRALVAAPSPATQPLEELPKRPGPRFLALKEVNLKTSGLYEGKWLQDLLPVDFNIESVSRDTPLDNVESIVAVIIKNQWAEQLAWLERIRAAGRSFKILHLSDEHGNDPIHFYDWPEVSGVLRFYSRPNLPSKVVALPLGYHWQFKGNRDVPHLRTPELPFREFLWSFAGTNWMSRKEQMGVLEAAQPRYVKWFDDWNSPNQLGEDEYIALLLNSKFVPCPRGQNVETYRFYEALECGCVPVFPKQDGDEEFLKQFNGFLPFLNLQSWDHVAALMVHMTQNPELMENYRKAVLIGWSRYKMELKERVRKWLV